MGASVIVTESWYKPLLRHSLGGLHPLDQAFEIVAGQSGNIIDRIAFFERSRKFIQAGESRFHVHPESYPMIEDRARSHAGIIPTGTRVERAMRL